VYAILRSGTSVGEHPVHITPSGSFFSDTEVRAHLLCDECEERSNRNGEDWTLENCWQGPSEFRLRNTLQSAASVEPEPGYHVFGGTKIAGVKTPKLVYFAVSVFWRAAARWWRIDKGPLRRLMLGQYEEHLRLFLLGQGGRLPAGVALLIGVSAAREERYNRVAEYPTPSPRSSGFHTYRFSIPGLTFLLFVGGQLPRVAESYCASRTGTLFMSAHADAVKLQHFTRLAKAAPRRGKLRALRETNQD
jgi:hypothetical protein